MQLRSHGSTSPAIAEHGHHPADASSARFADVRGRNTLDYALRTVQQTQSGMSAMADTKASIMITVCSIVLTIGISRFDDPSLRWPLAILTGSILAALLCAVLAVLPSFVAPRGRDGTVDVDAPWFNLLFFGHFTELPRDTFEDMLAELAGDDARIYAMLARDIYGQGIVLARRKFRLLRWSYLLFFAGISAAAICAVVALFLPPT